MKNICLILEYLGTNYCGFQKQINGLSIQEVLENTIEECLGEKCKTYPSGRTDAGVHALGQVVNFFTSTTVQPEKVSVVLNLKLPINSDFKDSRFSLSLIHQLYTLLTSSKKSPLIELRFQVEVLPLTQFTFPSDPGIDLEYL